MQLKILSVADCARLPVGRLKREGTDSGQIPWRDIQNRPVVSIHSRPRSEHRRGLF
jgi:hypothetical protein